MTHQLYLLRHAEAAPGNPLGNDFSRKLTKNGTRQAQLASDWALKTLPPPDTILCSSAKRTRETLAPFLAQWPKLLSTTDYVDSMYNASLDMLLTLAEDAFSYSERLLMVGHKPGIEQFLNNILKQDQDVALQKMPPGTLAVVEFPSEFRRGAADGKLVCRHS